MLICKSLLIIILNFLLLLSPGSSNNKELQINIVNIKNKTGVLSIAVFTSEENFKQEKPIKKYTLAKSNAKSGTLSTKISLSGGEYGIAILDDENKNGKMDYGVLLPLEGVGLSMYKGAYLKKPKFSEIKFPMTSNKTITIKMKYF